MDLDWHMHLPTPGELYSSSVGSAITTVIAALVEEHRAAGGRASVLVCEGRDHEARGAELVTFPRPDRPWLSRNEKLADTARGAVGRRRKAAERIYHDAIDAIPESFDGLLFLHNAPAAVPLVRALRPRAVPVLYAHNDLFRGWARRERRRLLRDVHRAVFVSDFVAERLFRGAAVHPKVRVVLNGATPSWFGSRREWMLRDHADPLVLYVGKVTRHKGVDVLAGACTALWNEGLRFRLRVVGRDELSGGNELTPFERSLRENLAGYGDRVTFAGFVDRNHIGAEYAEADIACVPSNWEEPCALALCESLVAGLPTVTTATGGLPQLAGGAARLVAPGAVNELASALRELILKPASRTELAAAARTRAKDLTWAARYRVLVAAVQHDALVVAR